VWNEQFPAFPVHGPTLAWARRFNRAFDFSLCELARFLEVQRDFDDIKAICETYDPIARTHMSLVRQNDVSAACSELDTKQAAGTARIFNDTLAQPQTAVERV
jgi:hypothetical protein